jgi:hypothetical protein
MLPTVLVKETHTRTNTNAQILRSDTAGSWYSWCPRGGDVMLFSVCVHVRFKHEQGQIFVRGFDDKANVKAKRTSI